MRSGGDERPARVVSVGRNAVWVAFEDETALRLGSLRKHIERLALVPGDLVIATPQADGSVVVDGRRPRSFTLERSTARGRTRAMAANIDGIAIVAAFARPPLHLAMIDELLAFAAIHDVTAQLVLTKSDLAESDTHVTAILKLYRDLGYAALAANPKTGAGIAAVRAALAHGRTLLIGQSGVGKSSLFRALGGEANVGDVSKGGRGKQTTSTGRLHRFAEGFLIDSPGVGDFELHGCTAAEIAVGFTEFAPLLSVCRFRDCTHLLEPGCAIREAATRGLIAASRYESYTGIVRERGAVARGGSHLRGGSNRSDVSRAGHGRAVFHDGDETIEGSPDKG